ncbi:MAG: chlorhexidine efflux transporter [Marinagarivorans sp.]|nr:chlorhexidine efflux transporter [Marinagarivorans sp.]
MDCLDARWFGRVASDRRRAYLRRLQLPSAIEASTLVVTLPLIVWIGGFSWWDALVLDLGLTLFYTEYAWVFHWCFDRLRPIKTACTPTPSPITTRSPS